MSRLETQNNDTLNTDLITEEDGRLVLGGTIIANDDKIVVSDIDAIAVDFPLIDGSYQSTFVDTHTEPIDDIVILSGLTNVVLGSAWYKIDYSPVLMESGELMLTSYGSYFININGTYYAGEFDRVLGETGKITFSSSTVPSSITISDYGTYVAPSGGRLPLFKWDGSSLKVLKDDGTYGTITVS